MFYTLEIDLSSPTPAARAVGLAAVAGRSPGQTAETLDIGQVTSPNSPTGARWAVEEISAIAERVLGNPPADIVIAAPHHWGPTNRQAFATALADAGLRANIAGHSNEAASADRAETRVVQKPEPEPEATDQPAPLPPAAQTAPAPPTSTTGLPAAPSAAELYSLPHIDDEPLPEFVLRRRFQSEPPAAPESAAAPSPIPSKPAPNHAASTAKPAAQPGPMPPHIPPMNQPARANSAMVDDGPTPGRGALIFALAFVVVGVGFALLLLTGVIGGAADPGEQTSADLGTEVDVTVDEPVDSETPPEAADDQTDETSPDPSTTDASDRTCTPAQFPRSDVQYRVSDIPARYEAQTLNGRNVPSVSAVDGTSSRVITEFPEFSQLNLDPTRCQLNENGRPWWAVTFSGGPDGIAWASTLYIEKVPLD